ncbi:OmpA family protein [Flavobacterium sp. T12S277]|uniref:OmpA family protein n=1 Tax=Flavobacterium sp. T12S277 TaxID=3402752 RepID=UPI003AE045A2
MKIKNLIYSSLMSIIAFQGYAQKAKVAAADKEYDRYAYVDAIATYERVANKGYTDESMFQKLGNAYYFNAELEKAEKWYEKLFDMNQNQDPEYYYRYSQCLKSIGDYAKSDKMMTEFNHKSGNDLRAKLFKSNRNYLDEIKANSWRYTIENAGINSKFSDYGSSFSGNNLVFASARDTGGIAKKVFKWNNQSFTNLYRSEMKSDGSLGKPERFDNRINSKFHESTPVFTKDGKTMYFTRNNFLNGKKKGDSERVTLLKLYKSTLEKGVWSNVTELPFNSDQYSVAHPALSVDEKTLYFASDMPGTLGQSDLFKVKINDDGSYGTPENLGDKINTEGRETFPFISDHNELYYASDGHPGLGGLDIFVAQLSKDGSISESQNVGEPVNGKTDDFALLINGQSRTGFFTTNRSGGEGYDDIYRFTETKKLTCEQELAGVVTDLGDGKLLPMTQVILFDNNFKELQQVVSDEKAHYAFEVKCGETYYVRAIKADYITKEQSITIVRESGKTDLPIALEKAISKVTVGDDLAKSFKIEIIYFDLDKSFIRKDAAFELEKILDVMKQYPTMKIDVRSHTDSRQTHAYNEKLSDRRAKSTIAWLVKNGIAASRLTGRGYGETQLVNKCADGVKCTEAEHQANRRSEFIITSM